MIVDPAEFVPARDASRKLGELIDRVEAGEIAKAVIVDRNKPRAVLLSVLGYEALVNDEFAAAINEPMLADAAGDNRP